MFGNSIVFGTRKKTHQTILPTFLRRNYTHECWRIRSRVGFQRRNENVVILTKFPSLPFMRLRKFRQNGDISMKLSGVMIKFAFGYWWPNCRVICSHQYWQEQSVSEICMWYRVILVDRAQIKENTKAPRHWPLCVEFTGDRWIPRTNGQ